MPIHQRIVDELLSFEDAFEAAKMRLKLRTLGKFSLAALEVWGIKMQESYWIKTVSGREMFQL